MVRLTGEEKKRKQGRRDGMGRYMYAGRVRWTEGGKVQLGRSEGNEGVARATGGSVQVPRRGRMALGGDATMFEGVCML